MADASELIWDVEDDGIVWFRVPWPPNSEQIHAIDRVVRENTDKIAPVVLRGGRAAVDLNGNVNASDIHFRRDGRMEGQIPAVVRKSHTGIGNFRDLRMVHFIATPDGRIELDTFMDAVPLPSATKTFREWLNRHRSGLKKQRGRGVYRRHGVYIRFGKWSGASKVFLEERTEESSHGGDFGFDRKTEAGVSVYQAIPRPDGGYDIASPNAREAIYGIGSDYMPRMLKQFRSRIELGELYLVAGTWLSYDGERVYGSDGEPVLDSDSIRVLAELFPEDVYWGNKTVADIIGISDFGRKACARVAIAWLRSN